MRNEKAARWRALADGHWHIVRTGPEGEPRADSLRELSRYKDSIQGWAARNGCTYRISRQDNGRIIRAQLTPIHGSLPPTISPGQAQAAVKLLEYALHLRQHGERAPGGNETWREFDTRAEAFLRKVKGLTE